jgi:hypothetical protein
VIHGIDSALGYGGEVNGSIALRNTLQRGYIPGEIILAGKTLLDWFGKAV